MGCPTTDRRRSPFQGAAGEENVGAKVPFYCFLLRSSGFEGEPWVVKSNIEGKNDPRSWDHRYPYLTALLQGWYQVSEVCVETHFKAVYQLLKTPTSLCIGLTPTSIRPTQRPAGAAVSVCASAHPCAAERRLTVARPCVHRVLHTSISCPF